MTHERDIALEDRTRQAARLSSPSAGRNKAILAETLAQVLPARARVIEIASGTGEHALAIVTSRPDLDWTPSEPDAQSRASVDSWAKDAGGRIRTCLDLDVTAPGWGADLGPFHALVCANMIHIAPWQATEGLFEGAARLLSSQGLVCFYGPFREGADTAASNLKFDASLKSRDPRWGVRERADVDALARRRRFEPVDRIPMPANNLVLVYRRIAP